MDWLRARVLLLITFVCLNAFLGYRLWARDAQNTGVLTLGSREHVSVVQARLAAVGISVAAPIPENAPSLSLLRVARTTPVFAANLLANFDVPAPPHRRPVGGEPRAGVYRFIQFPGGLVIYSRRAPAPHPPAPSTRVSRRMVDDFFRRYGGLPGDAEYAGSAQVDEERMRIDYVQMWSGVPLLPTGLSLTVTSSDVEQAQWLWLQPQGERGEPKAVLPASEALLRLAGHLGDRERRSPLVFTRIDLGYYATPPGGAQVWDTAPVWRISVEDGQVFYINAFTGELELDR